MATLAAETEAIGIKISSDWAGNGATSLAARLSELFGLTKITGGGTIWRTMAFHWDQYKSDHAEELAKGDINEAGVWAQFQEPYQKVHEAAMAGDFAPLAALLETKMDQQCDEDMLERFDIAQDMFARDQTFWDQLPELSSAKEWLELADGESFILEAKLAVLLQKLLPHLKLNSHTLIKICLTGDPYVNARRVLKRQLKKKLGYEPSEEEVAGIPEEEVMDMVEQNRTRINKITTHFRSAWNIEYPQDLVLADGVYEIPTAENETLEATLIEVLNIIAHEVKSLVPRIVAMLNIIAQEVPSLIPKITSILSSLGEITPEEDPAQ